MEKSQNLETSGEKIFHVIPERQITETVLYKD